MWRDTSLWSISTLTATLKHNREGRQMAPRVPPIAEKENSRPSEAASVLFSLEAP